MSRTAVRPAAVAGLFYPSSPPALQRELAACLAQARPAPMDAPTPKMLLVPHAGYVYSGPIAAQAYARLSPARDRIRRVVLLGPTHRVAVRGLAAPAAAAFETPLGRVAIDRAARAALADLPQVVDSDAAHAREHALEVQLPFLQTVLAPGFTLLPLAVGQASAAEVDAVLQRLWGGDETLIVISSDLSHYLPYDAARRADRATVERILALDERLDPEQACGAAPLAGALRAAHRQGLAAELLDLRNSGDTAGDHSRVVGYAAVAFAAAPGSAGDTADEGAEAGGVGPRPDDPALGRALLSRARNAIAAVLGLARRDEPWHPALDQPGASFVTLQQGGALRGCIGTLQATRRLEDDVRQHARAAAFHDPRFAPLAAAEWSGLAVEVSVLDAPQPLAVASEAEARQRLRRGVDGVVLDWRGRSATFLPQVWEQLPEPADFLAALKRKAGLRADFWSPELRLERYQVRKFCDAEDAR